jgi:hypothetical protein
VKKRTVAILVVVGVVLFAYFVPVVRGGGSIPSNCVFCPAMLFPYYSSLTYAYLGSGAVYSHGSYYFELWGTNFYYP